MAYELLGSHELELSDGSFKCPRCGGTHIKAERYQMPLSGTKVPYDALGSVRHMFPTCTSCGLVSGYLSVYTFENAPLSYLEVMWNVGIATLAGHKTHFIQYLWLLKTLLQYNKQEDTELFTAVKESIPLSDPFAEDGLYSRLPEVIIAAAQLAVFKEPSFFNDYIRTYTPPSAWRTIRPWLLNAIRSRAIVEDEAKLAKIEEGFKEGITVCARSLRFNWKVDELPAQLKTNFIRNPIAMVTGEEMELVTTNFNAKYASSELAVIGAVADTPNEASDEEPADGDNTQDNG